VLRAEQFRKPPKRVQNCSEKQTERTELAVIAQLVAAVEPFQTFHAREKTHLRRFGSLQP